MVLSQELSEIKSGENALDALSGICDLTAFSQNLPFCLGKAKQHISDIIFMQIPKLHIVQTGLEPASSQTWC